MGHLECCDETKTCITAVILFVTENNSLWKSAGSINSGRESDKEPGSGEGAEGAVTSSRTGAS